MGNRAAGVLWKKQEFVTAGGRAEEQMISYLLLKHGG
jgi:hypothetical protein